MLFSESPDMSDTNQEFAIQASHQQHNRGQGNAPPSSGPGNRWVEGHTNSNSRQGPGGNRNGNNHIGHGVPTEHAPRNEGSNHQPNRADNQFYPSHGQSQHKPLFSEPPVAYNHQRLANPPPTNFPDQQHPPYHGQPNHMHQEREGGKDHAPSRLPMYEASSNDYERHGNSYRERDSPWESQSFRSRGDYPKERFHPYQRPQHSSGYHGPPNFR